MKRDSKPSFFIYREPWMLRMGMKSWLNRPWNIVPNRLDDQKGTLLT
ncbi:hypothetical protein [Clostridium thermosuccinogenes]|nr:hypothetical protein [Pseudoclostridium thermosuccinogenes]